MKIKKKTLIIAIVVIIAIIGLTQMTNNTGNTSNKVKLETNQGDIVIELYTKEMPITTSNFINLIKKGTYDNTIFHRIINNFMLQGGDPTGTGFGDPNIPNIQDEFTGTALDENDRGTISMANAGPNTGSSQFFLNLVDNNFLDGKHPVFGKITDESLAVIDAISEVQTNAQDKPLEDVVIVKASLI